MSLELQVAAAHGKLELVGSLLENMVDANGTYGSNTNYHPPLNLAAKNGHIKVVKLLIEKGANLESTDNCGYGYTPLHQACRAGHIEIVELLLSKGANHDATDCNGETPLHLVCKKCHTNIASLLIENKASLNIANNDGVLPLLLAVVSENNEIKDLLIKNGAKFFSSDNNAELWSDVIRKQRNIGSVKRIIDALLLKKLDEKKPAAIQQHEELSAYWDKKIEKICYFSLEESIGGRALAKDISTSLPLRKDSLLSLSFHHFFKSLNPEAVKEIKNKVSRKQINLC